MREIVKFKARADLLIQSLISEYQWLNLLKCESKKYIPLLDYLLQLGQKEQLDIDEYSRKAFQVNEIAQITGVKTPNVKKFLIQIYEDLLQLNQNNPELFNNGNQHKYLIYFKHFDYCHNDFTLWLPTELRVFDRFQFAFIQGKVDCSYFWVKDISHIHEYGEIKTFVEMASGFPNIYRELLLDKADFLREISIDEKYSLTEYQMDERLKQYARREKL